MPFTLTVEQYSWNSKSLIPYPNQWLYNVSWWIEIRNPAYNANTRTFSLAHKRSLSYISNAMLLREHTILFLAKMYLYIYERHYTGKVISNLYLETPRDGGGRRSLVQWSTTCRVYGSGRGRIRTIMGDTEKILYHHSNYGVNWNPHRLLLCDTAKIKLH